MPEIGEIKRDLAYAKFIWVACVDCGKPRWVKLFHGQPESLRCRQCSPKLRSPASYKRGENSPSWIRGWKINKDGYREILIQPDDFFYPMVKKDGYVLEHRLVMAKSLGRNLQRWEIVHHKNKGDKLNNRVEKLQLVSDDRHNQITILENKILNLQRKNEALKAENRRLKNAE